MPSKMKKVLSEHSSGKTLSKTLSTHPMMRSVTKLKWRFSSMIGTRPANSQS